MSDIFRIAMAIVVAHGGLTAGYMARRRRPSLEALGPTWMRFVLLYVDTPLTVLVFRLLPYPVTTRFLRA